MIRTRASSRLRSSCCVLAFLCGSEFVHGLPVSNVTRNVSYASIQAAIQDALAGDEIAVNPGVYRENISFLGKNITVRSTNPDNPAVVASTILNGDTNGNPATPDGPVVTFENGEGRSATLAGFTVREGSGKIDPSESWRVRRGGGIFCREASPTIRQCIIVANGSHMGGGVYIKGGHPLLERNRISDNVASHSGGGIKVFHASIPEIRIEIRNNIVGGNKALENDGGGIDFYQCPAAFAPLVRNNVLVGNYAAGRGGGVACSSAFPVLRNNIICFNRSRVGGRGIHAYSNSVPVDICHNNVWSNPTPASTHNYGGGARKFCRSGELSVDPRFVSPGAWFEPGAKRKKQADDVWASGDYHLQPGSPCIDAGDPAIAPGAGEKDIDGQDRLRQTQIDMGAYEANLSGPVLNVTRDTHHDGIQEAIYLAGDTDEIEVGPGTYAGSVFFVGKAIHLRSTNPTDPAVVAATVIEGVNGGGSVVMLGAGTISGFTITGGRTELDGHGGGVTAYGTAVVSHNVISGNRTASSTTEVAGGVLAAGTSSVTDNIIEDNECIGIGGGGVLATDHASIARNIIRQTRSSVSQAAVAASGNARITGNLITQNAGFDAGGVYATDSVLIEGNLISENRNDTDFVGAGGILADTSAVIRGNVIIDNSAFGDAGGIRAFGICLISNNTILRNQVSVFGGISGGLRLAAGVSCRNNIVAFNDGGILAGGISGPVVDVGYNCVYGNTCRGWGCGPDYGGGAVPGLHDLPLDPMLDPDGYHLMPSSPCVNAGDSDGDYTDQLDIDGEPRVQCVRVDIGADETPYSGPPDFDEDCDVDVADLMFMNACKSSANVPHNGGPNCQAADLDGDGDIDLDDFGLFQRQNRH